MRVGLFSNAYHPVVSGVVNSLAEIRKGLLKRHHTPFLFAPEVRGYREKHAGVFRFPSLDLDPKVGFPVPIPFSARLARIIPRMGLDLIHSHHPILIGASAANFAQRLALPLVYTFHTQIEQYTHYVPFFSHETVRERARLKVSRYLNKCQLIISPSPGIRDLIDSYGVSTRVVTLPNAIDLSKFQRRRKLQPDLRERLGLAPNSKLSLSVGRLATEKGLPFLLRALSKFKSESEHHLVLVGDGPQKAELRRLAEHLDISHRTHFVGAKLYRDMPGIYSQCEAFVICSTTEVKPLVVLEALASGLPVVAVSACGTRDTLHHQHDGLLSDLDERTFLKNWQAVINSPELRSKLSKGAIQTSRSYSMDSYTSRLCALYQEVLQQHRQGMIRKKSVG